MTDETDDDKGTEVPPSRPWKTALQISGDIRARGIEKKLSRKDLTPQERKGLEKELESERLLALGLMLVRSVRNDPTSAWMILEAAQAGPLTDLPGVPGNDPKRAANSAEYAEAVLTEYRDVLTPDQRDVLERWIEKARGIAEGQTPSDC